MVASGATVSKISYYVGTEMIWSAIHIFSFGLQCLQVPFMVLCAIVTSIGSGASILISVDTPTVQWAAYLVISGFGIGLGVQLPYTALQVILE